MHGAELTSQKSADSAIADPKRTLASASRPTTNDATSAFSCLLGEKSMRRSKILPLIMPIEVRASGSGSLQVSWTMLLLRESYKLSVSISS